jgi:hypothetical protein
VAKQKDSAAKSSFDRLAQHSHNLASKVGAPVRPAGKASLGYVQGRVRSAFRGPVHISPDAVPHGFRDRASFQRFGGMLHDGLAKAG